MKNKIIGIFVCILFIGVNFFPSISSYDKDTEKMCSGYDLVIIAPKKFISSLEPLVEHKNFYGVKTLIKNVDEIYEEFEGRDKAEQVKYYIKYAIEKWDIEYVLLIGGRKGQSSIEDWWVPVRYSHIEWKNDEGRQLIEKRFISDLYFADIYDKDGNFSSWDTDNDGIFGEWPQYKPAEDIIDLYPDVYLGRLPCRNIFNVKIIVNKIINYETEKCDDSWFKKIVVVGGDSFVDIPGYEGEEYTQKGLEYMPDFNHIKLWTSDGSLKSWRDVVKAFNKGCGFIWFSGGATPICWGTHLPNEANQDKWLYILRMRHIPLLLNNKKLPICINGGGCHNCMFNFSLGYSQWATFPNTRCMGEALTFKLFGGSIAIIGPTSVAYETPNIISKRGGIEWLDIHFFEEYNISKTHIFGEIWGKTIYNYLQNFSINWNDASSNDDSLIVKNVEAWLILGDPSLKIGGYK